MTEVAERPAPSSLRLSLERGWQKLALIRDLAVDTVEQRELARRYGVTATSIRQFTERHAPEIAEVQRQVGEHLTGLWVTDVANRLAEYQADIETLAPQAAAGSTEAIKVRASLLKAVAEELGQLPAGVTNVLNFVIEGVDMAALR